MKYFEISDDTGLTWNCRGLPFDKDLIGPNKLAIKQKQTLFVKDIPKNLTARELEDKFKNIAKVHSA